MIWEELSKYIIQLTCNVARDLDQTMSFLIGLNDSYAQIRGQILLMEPILSVNRIFSLLIQEERQRDVNASQQNDFVMAFNVRSNANFNQNSNKVQVPNRNSNQIVSIIIKVIFISISLICKRTSHTQKYSITFMVFHLVIIPIFKVKIQRSMLKAKPLILEGVKFKIKMFLKTMML